MANPNKGQGGPVLPWLCELLSEVYPRLLQCCPPPLCTHLQDPAVGLGFTRAEGVRCPEEGCHLRSHPHLPFPVQSLLPRMRRLQLCDRSSTLPGTSRCHPPPNHLHIKGILSRTP